MKTRVIIIAGLIVALFWLGGLSSGQGLAADLAKPTTVAPTQPPPPPVETGANAPLVLGAAVLLIIIVGGIALNMRGRKSTPQDH